MALLDNQKLDRVFSSDDRIQAHRPGERHQLLLQRAAFLPPPQRTLIELAACGELSTRQIASLIGCAAGTLSRRLRRIINRLHDPLVVLLLDQRNALAPDYRQLGIEYFLHGVPSRKLAQTHQISQRQVLRMLDHIRGWAKGIRQRR